jgi:hypothetical protein
MSELECMICYDKNVKSLECHKIHVICKECIVKCDKCPFCKKEITKEFIEIFLSKSKEELLEELFKKTILEHDEICNDIDKLLVSNLSIIGPSINDTHFERIYYYCDSDFYEIEPLYIVEEKINQMKDHIPSLILKKEILKKSICMLKYDKTYKLDFNLNDFFEDIDILKKKLEFLEEKCDKFFRIYSSDEIKFLSSSNKPLAYGFYNFFTTEQTILNNNTTVNSNAFMHTRMPKNIYVSITNLENKERLEIYQLCLYIDNCMLNINCLNERRIALNMNELLNNNNTQNDIFYKWLRNGQINIMTNLSFILNEQIKKDMKLEINILVDYYSHNEYKYLKKLNKIENVNNNHFGQNHNNQWNQNTDFLIIDC